MIFGVANSPIPDRENELIESAAMAKAIPAFMKNPILHYMHTERPIGVVTDCRVLDAGDPVLDPGDPLYDSGAKIGDTYFWADIDEHGTDDIWDGVQKGRLNKISIYGVRTLASDECKIRPHERASPCITKSIVLWSFSLVGDNAINTGSYIKIAKSFSPDLCSEFESDTIELIKSAFPGVTMAPNADQQDQVVTGESDDGNVVVKADVVMKSEFAPVIQDVTLLKSDMACVKTGVDTILDFIKKSDQDATTHPDSSNADAGVPATVSGDYITKANLESVLDIVIKAKLEVAVSELKKAYDAKIAELEKTIAEFGGETIRKGGNMVVLDMDGSPYNGVDNSFISNLEALEG